MTAGDLPLNITWLFNGTDIDDSFGVSQTMLGKRLSVLNIDYVNGYHAGNYSCQASNRAAFVNYTAELIVNGIYEKVEFIHPTFGLTSSYRCCFTKNCSLITFPNMIP